MAGGNKGNSTKGRKRKLQESERRIAQLRRDEEKRLQRRNRPRFPVQAASTPGPAFGQSTPEAGA